MQKLMLFAVMLSCQPMPAHYARSVQVQHEESVSITAICIADDGSSFSAFSASGTRISSTQVLTAAHVTHQPAGQVCMWMGTQLGSESGVLLTPEHVDEARDLAVMSSLTGSFGAPDLYTIGPKPELGDTICEVSANPYHIRRCGEVQLNHDTLKGFIDSTMIAEPGNSGSPVYNARGELVGVISAMWTCRNGQMCGSYTASLDDAELQKLLGAP
jgi:hypothetical protein